MHTKESLVSDFRRLGINTKGILWIQMSLKSVGPIAGGADTFLDAVTEFMEDGLLLLPSHSWDNVNREQPVYSVSDTPVCIGIVPELFRNRPSVHRSLHPTHAVAAHGAAAEAFVAGQERFHTPCHPDSCYGRILKEDATVLMIGVNFSRNTLIHCIEEIADVPGRLNSEAHPLVTSDQFGQKHDCHQYRHIGNISENYPKMEKHMRSQGLMHDVKIGQAETRMFSAGDLLETTLRLLKSDIRYFDSLD